MPCVFCVCCTRFTMMLIVGSSMTVCGAMTGKPVTRNSCICCNQANALRQALMLAYDSSATDRTRDAVIHTGHLRKRYMGTQQSTYLFTSAYNGIQRNWNSTCALRCGVHCWLCHVEGAFVPHLAPSSLLSHLMSFLSVPQQP